MGNRRVSYIGITTAFSTLRSSLCEYRIMALPQLSKLMTGVRFPLLALFLLLRRTGKLLRGGSTPPTRSTKFSI